jgi:tetratricopeptide (TPR) repeat protein
MRGERETARVRLLEELSSAPEAGDHGSLSFARLKRGEAAYDAGDLATARTQFTECLQEAEVISHKRYKAMAVQKLGQVALKTGNLELARGRLEEALALGRELNEQHEIAISLRLLGEVTQAGGDLDAARAYYVESLTLFRPLRYRWGIAWGLDRLAGLAVAQTQAVRAARLFGAAAMLREAAGVSLPPVERPQIERELAVVCTALGEEAFAAAWSEGRAMPMDQAVGYALESADA